MEQTRRCTEEWVYRGVGGMEDGGYGGGLPGVGGQPRCVWGGREGGVLVCVGGRVRAWDATARGVKAADFASRLR